MVFLLLALETSSRGSKTFRWRLRDCVKDAFTCCAHEKALDAVDMEDLKKYAAEPESKNGSNIALDRKGVIDSAIKERTELAGKGEMTSKEL
jgi:hypothetical protein